MVFAAVQGKAAYLESLSQGTWMHRSYSEFVAGFREFSSAEEFLQTPQAPQRFAKVWLAYQAKKQSIVADRRVILLMRDKTLQAMSAAGVTAYRLCKDMGLNLGNVYAYLNKGDATKVSKGTARRMMQHAEQLAAQ